MTTRKQLEAMVVRINELLNTSYELDKQLGGYRLTANQGSRDVSPRLVPRLMSLWLSGMLTGTQEFSAKVPAPEKVCVLIRNSDRYSSVVAVFHGGITFEQGLTSFLKKSGLWASVGFWFYARTTSGKIEEFKQTTGQAYVESGRYTNDEEGFTWEEHTF